MMPRLMFCTMIVMVLASCRPSAGEYNQRANSLAAMEAYEDAITAYQAAQVIEPENGTIYLNAGVALAADGRYIDAEAAFKQAIRRGDLLVAADGQYNLGNLYAELGDLEQAQNAYREALRLNPAHDDARYNLEIVNAQALQPTPTAIEMQTELNQDQANPTEPPTPNPGGEALPTPTPPENLPPPGPSPMFQGDEEEGEESQEESTPGPRESGDLDVEDAEELLEPVEAEQDRISTFRENYEATGEPDVDWDW